VNRAATFTLAALIAGGSAFALVAREDFPDPTLTPGQVASTNIHEICAWGYSQAHRGPSQRGAVLRRYGITGVFYGEIDHRVPLCLGGADTLENLWPQSDFKAKDRLEWATCRAVCQGRMDLGKAQQLFMGDWR
jgi:hypothetical protein